MKLIFKPLNKADVESIGKAMEKLESALEFQGIEDTEIRSVGTEELHIISNDEYIVHIAKDSLSELYQLEYIEGEDFFPFLECQFDDSNLMSVVIKELSEYYGYWYDHLNSIVENGCVSGVVGNMIYYSDTTKFHDEYEDEIDIMIDEYLESNGMEFHELTDRWNINAWDIHQLKNYKAWFAYEQIAVMILDYVRSHLFS